MSQSANEAWIAVFRRIPVNLHDALALGITTGAEIVVQKIVKLEPEFMMIRGRLAGTQDAGRVVFIPYAQLTFLAVQRAMSDAEVDAIFGQGGVPLVFEAPAVESTPDVEQPAAEDATVSDGPAPVKKPVPVSKSALVAKMRDRLKDAGK